MFGESLAVLHLSLVNLVEAADVHCALHVSRQPEALFGFVIKSCHFAPANHGWRTSLPMPFHIFSPCLNWKKGKRQTTLSLYLVSIWLNRLQTLPLPFGHLRLRTLPKMAELGGIWALHWQKCTEALAPSSDTLVPSSFLLLLVSHLLLEAMPFADHLSEMLIIWKLFALVGRLGSTAQRNGIPLCSFTSSPIYLMIKKTLRKPTSDGL